MEPAQKTKCITLKLNPELLKGLDEANRTQCCPTPVSMFEEPTTISMSDESTISVYKPAQLPDPINTASIQESRLSYSPAPNNVLSAAANEKRLLGNTSVAEHSTPFKARQAHNLLAEVLLDAEKHEQERIAWQKERESMNLELASKNKFIARLRESRAEKCRQIANLEEEKSDLKSTIETYEAIERLVQGNASKRKKPS